MILFYVQRNGTVTTTPQFVPQGSSMQDLTVISDMDYAYCTIRLTPASLTYIPDIECTPVLTAENHTLWTAHLPPDATSVPGKVEYQLIFTAADGSTQSTLTGNIDVPRGAVTNTPATVGELEQTTLTQLHAIISNIYAMTNGNVRELAIIGTKIESLSSFVTSIGSVTIPVSSWTDSTPNLAEFTIDGFGAGMVALLYPADEASKIAAVRARLSAYPTAFIAAGSSTVEVMRAEAGAVPDAPITLGYVIIKTGTSSAPTAVVIGVDAYGEGGTSGGVDAEAVKEIIRAVVPEWAQEDKPPEDAVKSVNGQKGDVKIPIPEVSKAAVGLGNVDNERQYSASNPPPYPVTSVNGKTGAVTVSADPAGTASTAVANHNKDNAAHTYIQQRIDALYTRVENFLDIDEETFDQLSEVLADIQANASALELLGTGKIDKSKISTSFTDTAPDMVASVALINELERLIGELESEKQTSEQVSAAISNALAVYLTAEQIGAAYQPREEGKGLSTNDYTADEKKKLADALTVTEGDKRYAKPSDIPTVPTALKNPNKITILGKEYDGSSPVSVSVEDITAQLPVYNGEVTTV